MTAVVSSEYTIPSKEAMVQKTSGPGGVSAEDRWTTVKLVIKPGNAR